MCGLWVGDIRHIFFFCICYLLCCSFKCLYMVSTQTLKKVEIWCSFKTQNSI
ncbi:unnamed protein product [Callosobruchus maculatus]|uniref:Uncharacterized protein n=1 Tax=Callosobruchus maculatus TaxID=64391 RepID=A0A653BVS0_CALMS|nr:unnamed protein product [Callosobruchus maculatus]